MPTVPDRPHEGQPSAVAPLRQLPLRMDSAIVERLDALAPLIAPLGAAPNRTMAARACILVGLDVLEAKHGKKAKQAKRLK
jgi:hypothetical protein